MGIKNGAYSAVYLFVQARYLIEYLIALLQILVLHTEGLQHLRRARRKQGFVE